MSALGGSVMTKKFSDQDRLDWLRLCRSDGIGPITFGQLIARYGTAGKALKELPALIRTKAKSRIKLSALAPVEKERDELHKLGGQLLVRDEQAYPKALAAIADPPPVLALRGNPDLLTRMGVSIVGARNASAMGRRMAQDLARTLGQAGLVITSGMARGIDGAAHEAAMTTGTIAVLAGGVDQIYPPEHAALYQDLIDQGAVVSEVRLGHVARARDFPKRNRIVSGLSLGVVVVEAAERSGTLITARLGLEQGRDIFAVPGSPLDPRCAGTNRLIRQGAYLVRSAKDVLEGLGEWRHQVDEDTPDLFDAPPPAPPTQAEQNEIRQEILSLLSFTPVHRDILVRETGAPPAYVADVLLDMILSGDAEEADGGTFTLSPDASCADT